MAKSKDDVKYATAQSKLSEDEALRVSYKRGTPLEGGKIADSEPVDLFSSAHNIAKAETNPPPDSNAAGGGHQSQLHGRGDDPAAAARRRNSTK